MPGSVDVVVVGGGLVGTALAWELRHQGASVALVDEHHPGRASDAGAGILSPETAPYPDDRWYVFARRAAGHYRDLVSRLEEEQGEGVTGFAECGLLSVSLRPGDDEWFDDATRLSMARAPDVLREITPEEATALFPAVGALRRVLHNPTAARVDGRLMTAALLRSGLQRGVDHRATLVTGLRTQRARVTGVDAGGTTIACGAVAIAGGAWSRAFESELKVTIPVAPAKGQIVHLTLPGTDTTRWPIVQPLLSHYLVAWPDSRVACGGTYEPEAGFDIAPTVAGLSELLRECLALAPGLARASLVEMRVGLRPVTPDGMPAVGRVPGWDNAYVDAGHGTEGLLLGPYSGTVLSRMVLEGGNDPGGAVFDPARFTS